MVGKLSFSSGRRLTDDYVSIFMKRSQHEPKNRGKKLEAKLLESFQACGPKTWRINWIDFVEY